ncbi:MAG: polyprenyl synthetase family protein [Oligoflexia bacterium]|nr:polyprenyl synthetase family protein [Oligoflexia bacterium]
MVRSHLAENIALHLNAALPKLQQINEVYKYAVLPPGKLFRPLLVKSIYSDLTSSTDSANANSDKSNFFSSPLPINHNHSLLASALEIHHAYTLVHDDLPALDNDDYRRNKLSTHKAWGEWKAILIGDGLLNISYNLISKIKHTNSQKVFKLFSSSLGTKGLIWGQILDLSINDGTYSFSDILKIHELKTARLIEISILASYLLVDNFKPGLKVEYKLSKDLFRLAYSLGISFQLLDDLLDMNFADKNGHEKEINPFVHFPKESILKVEQSLNQLKDIIKKYQLSSFNVVVNEYLNSVKENLIRDKEFFSNLHSNNINQFIEKFTAPL